MNTSSKIILSLLLVVLASTGICRGQFSLEKKYIHMRANDTIVKQEVAFKNPGRSGADVFWNFSKLQPSKYPYQVCFSGNDTLMVGEEHVTSYAHELNRGDSLLLQGYHSRTSRYRAFVPEIELKYPFHYADSLESSFYGEGKYCDKLSFVSQGQNRVKADAWGTMLLPDNDTLKNVMRICVQKDICEQISVTDSILLKVHRDSSVLNREQIRQHLLNDTVTLRMKTYRWYAEGYRYPVFETVSCETLRFGVPVSYYATAFYYPPEEHIYLEQDSLNRQLQEYLKEKSLSAGQSPSEADEDKPTHPMQKELFVYYNVYPNPVKDQLSLEYYISEAVPVAIYLYDMSGRLLENRTSGMQPAGIHTESIPMGDYPKGNYILRLAASERVFIEKIIKE